MLRCPFPFPTVGLVVLVGFHGLGIGIVFVCSVGACVVVGLVFGFVRFGLELKVIFVLLDCCLTRKPVEI